MKSNDDASMPLNATDDRRPARGGEAFGQVDLAPSVTLLPLHSGTSSGAFAALGAGAHAALGGPLSFRRLFVSHRIVQKGSVFKRHQFMKDSEKTLDRGSARRFVRFE